MARTISAKAKERRTKTKWRSSLRLIAGKNFYGKAAEKTVATWNVDNDSDEVKVSYVGLFSYFKVSFSQVAPGTAHCIFKQQPALDSHPTVCSFSSAIEQPPRTNTAFPQAMHG